MQVDFLFNSVYGTAADMIAVFQRIHKKIKHSFFSLVVVSHARFVYGADFSQAKLILGIRYRFGERKKKKCRNKVARANRFSHTI